MTGALSKQKCPAPPCAGEVPPQVPTARESDWPPFMSDRIWFEVELSRDKISEGDPDVPVLLVKGRIPVSALSRFEYAMISELEHLFNEKARSRN